MLEHTVKQSQTTVNILDMVAKRLQARIINDKNAYRISSSRDKHCGFSKGARWTFRAFCNPPEPPLYIACAIYANSRSLIALFLSPGGGNGTERESFDGIARLAGLIVVVLIVCVLCVL